MSCPNIPPLNMPSECKDIPTVNNVIYIKEGYNYPNKFIKALNEGNQKYIDSLFKRGIISHKIQIAK